MTGPSAPPAVDPGFVHPGLFYRDDEEYLAGTVPFLRAGLAAGEPVAVAVPPRNVRLLQDALDADPDVNVGRIRFLDMTVVGRNPGNIIPTVLRAFADAHRGVPVRIIGEPIWATRTADEYPACAQHEALINLAFKGRPVTILCPYHTATLSAQVLADAAVTHPLLIDHRGERISDRYSPYQIINGYNRPLPAPPRAKTLRFDLATVAAARKFAATVARKLRLPEARITDLEIAVTELAANSVTHGGGAGVIAIWADSGHIVCQVEDAGHLTDPLAGRTPVAADSIRGRGLLMVNRVADLVRTHSTPDGTTIRIHLARG
jgi:anti-sigma regulatory factor (Ser/Thr protein kinase)